MNCTGLGGSISVSDASGGAVGVLDSIIFYEDNPPTPVDY
jgi:hypothetical protein